MIKLCEYEEARKVRNMIDKILPEEEEAWRLEFERKIEKRRNDLTVYQERDMKRIEEKSKSIQWNCSIESTVPLLNIQ